MSQKEIKYRIALASLKGMTVALAEQLVDRLGSEERVMSLPASQIASALSLSTQMLTDAARRQALEQAEAEVAFLERSGVKALYFTDEAYPQRLRECEDAPVVLYVLGEADLNEGHMVSIVGTRHATSYGEGFIGRLVNDLSKRLPDTTIISGLAYGADIAAHREALTHQLPTVAVLAHGLTTIYPAAHRNVAARIVKEGGALVTEYTSKAPVHRGNFLARNRIVAGMSDALIVAESAERGGALVTARIASSYDRDVFAVPGRVGDPYSAGCNNLISRQLASLLSSPDQLYSHMNWTPQLAPDEQASLPITLNDEEQRVVDYLRQNPQATVNVIAIAFNTPIHRMLSLLGDMEYRQIITAIPGSRYAVL